jgi:hypothetical protein
MTFYKSAGAFGKCGDIPDCGALLFVTLVSNGLAIIFLANTNDSTIEQMNQTNLFLVEIT